MSSSRETNVPHCSVEGRVRLRHGTVGHRTIDGCRCRRCGRARGGGVHQPMDACNVSVGAGKPRASRFAFWRGTRAAGRSGSARSGASSTSCTSTISRCCRNSVDSGSPSALLTFVLQKGAELGARRATLEVRRSNDAARACLRALRLHRRRRAPRLLLETGGGCAGAVARRCRIAAPLNGSLTLKPGGPYATFAPNMTKEAGYARRTARCEG